LFVKFRFTSARQHPLQRVCIPVMGGLIDDCSLLNINTHRGFWEGRTSFYRSCVNKCSWETTSFQTPYPPLEFFYFPFTRKQFLPPNVNCERTRTLQVDLRRKTRVTSIWKKK
jgi:hypothetical protein